MTSSRPPVGPRLPEMGHVDLVKHQRMPWRAACGRSVEFERACHVGLNLFAKSGARFDFACYYQRISRPIRAFCYKHRRL